MIDVDFHAYLDSLTTAPVQENFASEDKVQPRVFWQRREGNVDLLLSGAVAMYDVTYDVEVAGLDIDATATIADTLKTSLHGFRGTMGGSFVLGMFATDHSDDYIPKSLDADEGFHVFAFSVKVFS